MENKSGLATASLVLGIIAIVFSFIPGINGLGLILGILAIVFGAIPIGQKKKNGSATAGLILGILAVIISIIISIAVVNVAREVVKDSKGDLIEGLNELERILDNID